MHLLLKPSAVGARACWWGIFQLLLLLSINGAVAWFVASGSPHSRPTGVCPAVSKRGQRKKPAASSSTDLFLSSASLPENERENKEMEKEERPILPYDDEGVSFDEGDDDEYCQVTDEFGCEAIENIYEALEDEDNGGGATGTSGERNFRWIRLENEADKSLQHVESASDAIDMIEQVKERQRRYGPCELYARQWEPSGNAAGDDDAALVLNGESVNGAGSTDSEFTVMQLNALAEGLSSGPSVKRPFRTDPEKDAHAQSEKQGYGGFTSVPHPEVALDFSLRRWRLLEVILRGNRGDSSLFDLIAMEEIDRYRGFFAPVLRLFGYEGLFMPKTRSPGVRMGWYSDGCCLFWKASAFELVSERRGKFVVGSQIYIIAVLRHLATGRLMVVAVTHLKASKSEVNEQIRCSQVEELLERVAEITTELREQQGENGVSVLVLGDFNTEDAAVRKVLDFDMSARGNAGDRSKTGRGKAPPLPTMTTTTAALRSAYPITPPPESLYTTWKIRGSEVRRIIDYIFYSNLECEATLRVPPEDELEETKLPGLKHPSDHMMIAAKFRIR